MSRPALKRGGGRRSSWSGRRSRKSLKAVIESLETRCLLSSTPPSLVVGRALSSYFVGGVQNNQETITYTVYNQQSDPETGVLLTTTLEPGVTLQEPPRRSLGPRTGQDLACGAWGRIAGNDLQQPVSR